MIKGREVGVHKPLFGKDTQNSSSREKGGTGSWTKKVHARCSGPEYQTRCFVPSFVDSKKSHNQIRDSENWLLKYVQIRGTWVAQSTECPTSAQVMISRFLSSSSTSGSLLSAQSLLRILSPLFSLPLPHSQKKIFLSAQIRLGWGRRDGEREAEIDWSPTDPRTIWSLVAEGNIKSKGEWTWIKWNHQI